MGYGKFTVVIVFGNVVSSTTPDLIERVNLAPLFECGHVAAHVQAATV